MPRNNAGSASASSTIFQPVLSPPTMPTPPNPFASRWVRSWLMYSPVGSCASFQMPNQFTCSSQGR